MSRVSFENYGRMALEKQDSTVISGRYEIQRRAERLIVADIARKLKIGPDDQLLEVGCGAGNLLIPLSFVARFAVGIDHPLVCHYLRLRFSDSRIKLIGMNFLDYEPEPSLVFDKILVYSVLNTLSDEAEALTFLDKAVAMLAPQGRLLLGDIANIDRKQRFLSTDDGQKFDKDWRAKMSTSRQVKRGSTYLKDEMVFRPSDVFVFSLLQRYRKRGYETYLLPQPSSLPFGHTREDVLVVAPGI